MHHHRQIYLDGAWRPSRGTDVIEVVNPTTEQVMCTVPQGTSADVDAAVDAARRAFPGWWDTPAARRAEYLGRVADRLEERAAELAVLTARDVGAPLAFARAAHVALPVLSFRHAADVASAYAYERQGGGSLIVREPYGVVGAITPWNYPLHQIAAKVAYALAAGNTVVLKPSEVAPLGAWALAEIFDKVGLPPGVFNMVSGTGPVVGEALAAHPGVDLVSFTGSTAVGRRVSRLAAKTVKRVTLELGGKSPAVLLPDADPVEAVPRVVVNAFLNSGQTCSALTRLVVPRSRLGEVEQAARQAAEAMTCGDPLAEGTHLGPLVSATQRERVRAHITGALAEGARLVTGGASPPDGLPQGYFVRPTVLSEVTPRMAVHRDEVFGPVLAIEPYDSVAEAVRLANDSDYGLAAAVWSPDRDRALAVARLLRAGQVGVNSADLNPRAPFGGYKQSGNGREHGVLGLEEFLEIKSVQA
ncbi:aldehyde dehydrogenase family protein [Streptomyces sp. NRRL S-920]|uniref:aldehyde dehydrogenase family protein n=1 Tax=Streptomyces sp. NRRL S-920 TaxID=1463921 RepID=UPI0004CA0278|nr:aldehyde dehydrogenase family protein [Streptomyces sp. NRRL S-920]